MKTGNVRRRSLPAMALALLLGLPAAAVAAPAAPAAIQGGMTVERVWEWVRGWAAGLNALVGEEGSMIDPDGSRAPEAGQGGQAMISAGAGGGEPPLSR